MILTFFFHSIWDFNHDILKQFILQIRIGYLGRLWVSDPLMDLRMGIKKSKFDGDGDGGI